MSGGVRREEVVPKLIQSFNVRLWAVQQSSRTPAGRNQCEPAAMEHEPAALDCKLGRNEREPAPCG